MSISDLLRKYGNNTPVSDIASITEFENDLDQYETIVVPNSTQFSNYEQPAAIMKIALTRLVMAKEADVFSMMRELVKRVRNGQETTYSDFTLRMLTSGTKDERAKQLIAAIVFSVLELVTDQPLDLGEGWLQLINQNKAILTFMENYYDSDQVLEESYSGNPVYSQKETEKLIFEDSEVTLEIGFSNYRIKLQNGLMQHLNLGVAPDIRKLCKVPDGQKLIISSELTITPSIGWMILDKSIDFFDDALAQLKALNCAPDGYTKGRNTRIVVPGLFYSIFLSVISHDEGKTWRVTELNILPPSLNQ